MKKLWKKCLASAFGFSLMTQALLVADTSSSHPMMMMDDQCMTMGMPCCRMTENELMHVMEQKDKDMYQSLNAETKAYVLRMANLVKMNNNPIMMMRQCMNMMNMMMSKMDMMEKQSMMNSQQMK